MTTLRIGIDSSDAVRGANTVRDALQTVGAAANKSELDVRQFSQASLELGTIKFPKLPPDPFGIKQAVIEGKAALEDLKRQQGNLPFGEGIPQGKTKYARDPDTGRFTGNIVAPAVQPFGAGLGDFKPERFSDALALMYQRAEPIPLKLKDISASFQEIQQYLSTRRSSLPPDPWGIKAAVAEGKAALEQLKVAQGNLPFGQGISEERVLPGRAGGIRAPAIQPFGAGIGEFKPESFAASLSRVSEAAIPIPFQIDQVKASVSDLGRLFAANKIDLSQLFGLRAIPADVFKNDKEFVERTRQRMAELTSATNQVVAPMSTAGDSLEGFRAKANKLSHTLELQAKSLLRFGSTVAVFGALAAASNELLTIESGLVRIERTTGLSADGLMELKDAIVELGTAGLPVATTDLLKFAESAGKLQIRTPEAIKQFVADLALVRTISPRLGGEAANVGEDVGTFLRLVGESPTAIKPFSDSITRLQKEFGATGDEIFTMGSAVAQAGAGFIRSSADALAFGAAFKTLSLDSEQGGMAIAKVMKVVRDAIYIGGPQAKTLRDVLGFSPEELERAFNTDASMLFTEVLSALGRQGTETARVLDDLGLGAARSGKVFTPLIANADQLQRALRESRDAQLKATDAAAAAEKQQKTLASELQNSANLFTAAVGANTGFVQGLAKVVSFGNDVTATLLGISGATNNVSASAEAMAKALETGAKTGVAIFAWNRLQSGLKALTAELTVAEVKMVGTAAASARLATAFKSFIASPFGIAVAVGAAVFALSELQQHFENIRTEKIKSELDSVAERITKLDEAAGGIARANALVLKADVSNDAEGKVRALTERLHELEAAQEAVVASVIRERPDTQEKLDAVKPELRAVIKEAAPEGSLLSKEELERRLNAAIAAAVKGVEIPGVPKEKADKFRQSVENVFSGVTIPTEQVKALGLDKILDGELLPESSIKKAISGSTGVFRQALSASISEAKSSIAAEVAPLQEELARVLATNPSQFAGAGLTAQISALSSKDEFLSRAKANIGEQVSVLFGPEVGRRAQAALTATFEGLEIPGIPEERSKELRASILAAFDIASVGSTTADGIHKIETSLREAGYSAKDTSILIANAISAEDGDADEKIELLSILLQEAGGNAISATDALKGLFQAQSKTNEEIAGVKKPEAEVRLSDFYVEDSKRITNAIREAELSINRLTVIKPPRIQKDGGSTEIAQGPDLVLVGIEARREAIRQERAEYEKLLVLKSGTKTPIEQRITGEEANLLREQANAYLEVRDAVLLYAEAQRRLNAESAVMGKVQGIIGSQLGLLGDRAQGETAQAFELMRREVELSTEAELKNIDAMERTGVPVDEVAKYREIAKAQKNVALTGIAYQESLAKNRRAVDDLSNASSSFASNATSALLGLQDPAEALRSFLIDIARQFLEPRLQNAFLGLTQGKEDKEPSVARLAAEQSGVGDLFRKSQGDGPRLDLETPSPYLAAQNLPEMQPFVADLEPVAEESVDALSGVGPSAQLAASGLDKVTAAAEGAAAALGMIKPPASEIPPGGSLPTPEGLPGGPGQVPFEIEPIEFSPSDLPKPQPRSALEAFQARNPDLPSLPTSPQRIGIQTPFSSFSLDAKKGLETFESGLTEAARASTDLAGDFSKGLSPALESAVDATQDLPRIASRKIPQRVKLDAPIEEQMAVSRFGAGVSTQAGISAAAAGMGGRMPIKVPKLGDLGDKGLSGAMSELDKLAPATAAASAQMSAVAQTTDLASTGMEAITPAVQATQFSLTPLQEASIAVVTSLNAAANAAIVFAQRVATAGAQSAFRFSHGGVVGGGQVRAFASGGLPTVSDLEGSTISNATYALIGEGDDDEAIMPLDGKGGVRGIGAAGQSLSLPLKRDSSGKLGVRVDLDKVKPFAMGGVPGLSVKAFASGGIPGSPGAKVVMPTVSPEQVLASSVSTVNNSYDQSKETKIYSTINLGGQRRNTSQMRYTMRQLRAEFENLGRMMK